MFFFFSLSFSCSTFYYDEKTKTFRLVLKTQATSLGMLRLPFLSDAKSQFFFTKTTVPVSDVFSVLLTNS